MIVLETERLYLRDWVPDDWKRFRPLATDPRVLRHIGKGQPWSDEQIKTRIAHWIETGRQRGWILWPLIHRDDAELIGFCGFWDGFAPDVEIGWRLLPDYWGQGIATEAATAVMDYGFRRWNFPRLISVAQRDNKASIRIMQKLGMQLDRTFVHEGFEVICYSKSNPALHDSRPPASDRLRSDDQSPRPATDQGDASSRELSLPCSTTDDALLTAFESCSLPHANWNHRAHVRVAFLYLSRFKLDDAIDKMRRGIRAYNAAHAIEDRPMMGYHETTTQAFMRLIHNAVRTRGSFPNSHEFCERNPELLDRRVLLCYYTRERLLQPTAKAEFLEPDLAPLNQILRPQSHRLPADERVTHTP